MRQCARAPCASSGSQAQLPSTGGFVVTVSAFSTAALSVIGASNCRMIGAATPTVWPSASWNAPPIFLLGETVVNFPATGTALPSCPTAEPLHV